jgi:ABC-type sugar transport system permease subunit
MPGQGLQPDQADSTSKRIAGMTLQETPRVLPRRASGQNAKGRRTPFRTAHLFVLPYVLFLLAFGIGPGLYALIVSFSKTVGGRPQLFQAGLKNYTTAFTDFRFGPAITHMIQFLAVSIPLGVAGVLLLSLLLHGRRNWFTTAMRTVYFVPGAVAGPALVLLAIFMFDPNVSPFSECCVGSSILSWWVMSYAREIFPCSLRLLAFSAEQAAGSRSFMGL